MVVLFHSNQAKYRPDSQEEYAIFCTGVDLKGILCTSSLLSLNNPHSRGFARESSTAFKATAPGRGRPFARYTLPLKGQSVLSCSTRFVEHTQRSRWRTARARADASMNQTKRPSRQQRPWIQTAKRAHHSNVPEIRVRGGLAQVPPTELKRLLSARRQSLLIQTRTMINSRTVAQRTKMRMKVETQTTSMRSKVRILCPCAVVIFHADRLCPGATT